MPTKLPREYRISSLIVGLTGDGGGQRRLLMFCAACFAWCQFGQEALCSQRDVFGLERDEGSAKILVPKKDIGMALHLSHSLFVCLTATENLP